MRFGFIKVAAATPEIRVANCKYNMENIKKLMDKASGDGVKVLVLPELCLTGYTCGDLYLQKLLLDSGLSALIELKKHSQGMEMLTVVGLPLMKDGKLYNCGAVLYNGTILGVVPKTFLPNYGEFYEQRHFTPALKENTVIFLDGEEVPFGTKLLFTCREMEDFCLALEICEDLWVPTPPSNNHATAGATIIANLSASVEVIGKDRYRRDLVKGQSARIMCAYLYSDSGEGESTTDAVFSAHNIIAEGGEVLSESTPFGDGYAISEVDVHKLVGERRRLTTFLPEQEENYQRVYFSMKLEDTKLTRQFSMLPFIPSDLKDSAYCCEHVMTIQAMGLKRRMEHTCSKTAVIGISGGLDSCLALLVAVQAMDIMKRPRTDIVAVTMPCFGTTERTKSNAELLCERLGVTLKCIDIGQSVKQHFKDIGHDFEDLSVVFENAQARERTQVLMDIANQYNGLVIGTGDLSELALGWATYNGDHMSMYGLNASIPKTLVRHVVKCYADISKDDVLRNVLLDILDTPVSPELLPSKEGEIAQITEDVVGPYELHDFFIYYIVRCAFPPKKVLHLAENAFQGQYGRETILKWLKTFYHRFFAQQFKRSCLPDGPKVSPVGLSPRGDWRMPSDCSVTLWLEELEEII